MMIRHNEYRWQRLLFNDFFFWCIARGEKFEEFFPKYFYEQIKKVLKKFKILKNF
jgi:hypothetical protein